MSGAPSQRFVQAGSVRWFVVEGGAGPDVLLVHGAGASADSFEALLPTLTPRFRVVAVDLPCHARTTARPGFLPDLPTMAAALSELVLRLRLEPRLVVGHSAGAAVLARMLLDGMVPPAALVGLAPAFEPIEGLGGALAAGAAKLLHASRVAPALLAHAADASLVERALTSTGSVHPGSLALYTRLARDPTHLAGVLAMLARWDLRSLGAELAALPGPLTVVAGAADLVVPCTRLERLARRLPRARLVVIPEAGHLLHEQMPRRVGALLSSAATSFVDTLDCQSRLTHDGAT